MDIVQWVWNNAEKLSGVGAILAFVIAVLALWAQRVHNKLSVTPLPEITYTDLEGDLSVTLVNHGTGPLIIETFDVSRTGVLVGDTLIGQMPQHIKEWDWFVSALNGRSLPVGGKICLLSFKTNSPKRQREVREALMGLTVHVVYSDVYKGNHPAYAKSLAWFGRHC